MIAIEYTLEDVGEPKLFCSEVTRNRLLGLEEELGLLLQLFSTLECTRPRGKGWTRGLSTARRLVARAGKRLACVGVDVSAALERRGTRVSWQGCGERIELKLAEGESDVEVAKRELEALGEKLSLLLVLLLTLGRTCKRLRREPLARAKSAVREARSLLLEAEAVMERTLSSRSRGGGATVEAELARRAS